MAAMNSAPRTSARMYAIVGSGAAGIAAAEAIRSQDPSGRIVLVCEEPEGYYSRPGLAYYLTGELPEAQLFPFSPADFARLQVERLTARAVALHLTARQVELAGGRRLDYDRLLLATGSRAVPSPVPGSAAAGVVKLDNLADARAILKLARRGRRAVVVGGGITALEIVEGLVHRGVKTHYFLRGARYWSNVLDETESQIVVQRLAAAGVQLHYHTELAEVLADRRGRVTAVRTAAGQEIACDLLAAAIGVAPRHELGLSAGLAAERGLLVNEFMQTSDPYIYAAGDVAQVWDPLAGKSVLDTLWGLARQQGHTAGLNMAGRPTPYVRSVPFNVTRLAGLTTTIIGLVGRGPDGDLAGIARGDSETWRQLPGAFAAQDDFEVNRLRVLAGEQTLIGAVVMGDQTLSRPLQHLIANRVDIRPVRDRLLEPGVSPADVIADFWIAYRDRRPHAAPQP